MTIQLNTAQTLKSFAATALAGIGLELANTVSCHASAFLWFLLRETTGALLWSVLSGLHLLGCPIQALTTVHSLLRLVGSVL